LHTDFTSGVDVRALGVAGDHEDFARAFEQGLFAVTEDVFGEPRRCVAECAGPR